MKIFKIFASQNNDEMKIIDWADSAISKKLAEFKKEYGEIKGVFYRVHFNSHDSSWERYFLNEPEISGNFLKEVEKGVIKYHSISEVKSLVIKACKFDFDRE